MAVGSACCGRTPPGTTACCSPSNATTAAHVLAAAEGPRRRLENGPHAHEFRVGQLMQGASSAISGNPAVRNTSITYCLVSCTAITELSTSCEVAAAILSSSLVRHRTLSLATVEPPL